MIIAFAYLLALAFKSIALMLMMALGVALAFTGCVPLALDYILPHVALARHEVILLILALVCGIALFLFAGAGLAAIIMPSGFPVP